MNIIPDNISSIKFIESDIFDSATIKDCNVNSITSLLLSYMKPEGRIEIIILS